MFAPWSLVSLMRGTNDHGRRIVTRAELLASGRSSKAIAYAIDDGRLFVVHAGVYAVGHPRLTDEERWLAAVRACGKQAWLDSRSAAEHRELLKPRGDPPRILVPAGKRVRRPGIVIARSRHIAAGDVTVHEGIPIVSVARMFMTIAATEDHRTLRRALRQAEYSRQIDIRRLRLALVDAVRGTPGVATLARTLDRYISVGHVSEADAEDDLITLCRRHRIPTPRAQYVVPPHRWDFGWPEYGVVLDIDEYDGHRQLIPLVEDRAKDRHATAAGLIPLRAIDVELRSNSAQIVHDLRAALREGKAKRAAVVIPIPHGG